MMNNEEKARAQNMIWGALVADAAAVGFHWLYEQNRIREIAPDVPEFRPPTPSDFADARGYFAHGHKHVGELSQYGEQAMVMLRSLVANGGLYDKTNYVDSFRKHFGYGGAYVGYIDRPTRDTLNNITAAEQAALKRAEAIPFDEDNTDGDNATKQAMMTKVLSIIKEASGAELRPRVEEAVRITHDDDNLVAYAFKIAAEFEAINGYHGADDEQLPAIAKLPALVAAYAGDAGLPDAVESAVRVTNDNELAVQFGHAAASMMESAIQGADLATATAAGRDKAAPTVAGLIDEALALTHEPNADVTARFGMACNLVYGVPSVVHNLVTAGTFREAIRQNIYAGGDSCGRAILLGAILGATNGIGGETGIPGAWIDKLLQKDEINELLQKLS